MYRQKILSFLVFGLMVMTLGTASAQIHHQLHINLDPDSHRLTAVDTLTLPKEISSPVTFRLHSGLRPQANNPEVRLRRVRKTQFTEDYAVDLPPGVRQFTLEYSGEIFHPIAPISEEYARSFSASPGLIAPEGVFLAGPSYWYPHFGEGMVTFSLTTQLPAGWHSVSQGKRSSPPEQEGSTEETWTMDHPQEEIYLIAGSFTPYREQAGQVETLAFLRQPDPALARKYLDATAQYIEMYRQLIGPYPYQKFALVENFWETGYGMPSFTLLGSRVIRFPFILRSSYPHEILHNWWGNGVYVDYDSGNWAEGLTSYLADHLLKEQQGQGAQYRRETLQKYADYVREGRDFPLTEFRSRHSAATQAVGYGKTLMLFHMLRQQLGDSAFIQGLQNLYRQHRFQVTDFQAVAHTFNQVSEQPLHAFFKQWVERTGAPSLRIREAHAQSPDEGYLLTATIEQLQPGKPYQLDVPVAIYLEDAKEVYQTRLSMAGKTHSLKLQLPARPLRLEIDPQFDVFRRLHRNEIPPALSQAFGAERALAVLPSQAPKAVREGYAAMARDWQRGRENLAITTDAELDALPTDRAVWLFGWENRFRSQFNEALSDYAYQAGKNSLSLEKNKLQRQQHSVVVVTRPRDNPDQALAWVATDNVAAMPGLARKLPHYGKYSYLGFTGAEPENSLKGQWPVVNSPMSVLLAEDSSPLQAELSPRKPLAELPPLFKAQRMMQDIAYLADPKLAGRGLGTPELDQAAQYIADKFQAAGLKPGGGEGNYYQTWTATAGEPERTITLRNVVGLSSGARPELPPVVVGAHYDHLGRGWPDVHQGDEGKIHPGADDNASGIAVMLELARILGPQWQPERTVAWVAFTGEEAGKLGSAHYVQRLGDSPAKTTMAMINLDAVGRLHDGELMVLAADSAREWAHIFRGAGFVTGVPIQTVAQDIGSSDQTSFLNAGIPAVQLFTGPHGDFHRPTDTPDKIDSAGLTKIAAVLKEAVAYLASRPDPLHGQSVAPGEEAQASSRQGSRRVGLGTIPDFGWSGTGVRISGVTPNTPAEAAGLQKDDIIIRLNDKTIDTLADFAGVLRALKVGDSLTIEFLRDQQSRTVTTQVVAR
ncbi:peptidase M28 [Nitrosococcus oceani]|nr:peptidase M28 [Nitrosococcus oceani]